jgi:hypothetical protein
VSGVISDLVERGMAFRLTAVDAPDAVWALAAIELRRAADHRPDELDRRSLTALCQAIQNAAGFTLRVDAVPSPPSSELEAARRDLATAAAELQRTAAERDRALASLAAAVVDLKAARLELDQAKGGAA